MKKELADDAPVWAFGSLVAIDLEMWLLLRMELTIDDVVWQRLSDEVVILHVASGTYFGLDGVGSRVWCLIAEHGSRDKIVEILMTEYDAPEEQIRQDVDELIQQLVDKRLVRVNGEEIPSTG
ncbi:MAG TPA: PqqD family protein [Candidatus Binataceae bacterium]|nr:PqqD family protein [Candidatus Binataceae bacterium]